MGKTIYKKLLEVKILHDYYLTKAYNLASTISFFNRTSPVQKAIIEKAIALNQYKIGQYFEISPIDETEKIFQQYKIRWIPTALGFFLGIEVKEKNTDLGANAALTTYQPFFKLPNTLHVQFIINSVDASLNQRAILPSAIPWLY